MTVAVFAPISRSNLPQDYRCTICLDSSVDSLAHKVGETYHAFCRDCLLRWFQQHRNCPVCRGPIDGPLGVREVVQITINLLSEGDCEPLVFLACLVISVAYTLIGAYVFLFVDYSAGLFVTGVFGFSAFGWYLMLDDYCEANRQRNFLPGFPIA